MLDGSLGLADLRDDHVSVRGRGSTCTCREGHLRPAQVDADGAGDETRDRQSGTIRRRRRPAKNPFIHRGRQRSTHRHISIGRLVLAVASLQSLSFEGFGRQPITFLDADPPQAV